MKKMVLYGAGGFGHYCYLRYCREFNIIAYADSDETKHGETLNGLPIVSPEGLADIDYDVIQICVGTSAEIIKEVLINKYKISESKLSTELVRQSDAARENALYLMSKMIYDNNIAGNVAELGVFRGKFAKEINRCFKDRILYLFDTFEGFPEQDIVYDMENKYSSHDAKYLKTTSIDEVLGVMPYPEKCVVKVGYFPDTLGGLEESFVLVSLDPDLYKPILEGMRYFYPRLQKGGFIMVHDYYNPWFSGVAEAIKDYEAEIGVSLSKIPIGDLMSVAITKV